jgi:hypothetical protein
MMARSLRSFFWLAEAALLLGVMAAGLAILGVPPGSLRPHPFGLVVLLIALQYGTIRAAAVTVAATLLLVPMLPAQEFGEEWNRYLLSLVREPLIWCALVLVVGGFTDRQRRRRNQAEAEAAEAREQLARMVEVNEAMSASHRALETTVAAQGSTAARIFEATRALGHQESSVVAGTLGLLKVTTGATSGALYLVAGGHLELAAADRDPSAFAAGPSIEVITALAAGRECLVASRAEDRAILDGTALLAGPLRSPEGALLGILTIEALPFRQFGLDTVANFIAVCGWVADALTQERALAAAEDARFGTPGCRFIGPSSTEAAAHFMLAIAARFQLDLTSIDIGLPPDRLAAVALMMEDMQGVFRNADLLLQARRDGTAMHALLLGTDVAGGWQAEARLRAAIAQHDPELAAAIATNVSCLYAPQKRLAA